jgi:hypothetical protein
MLVRLTFRASKYGHWRAGNCHFYGSSEFLVLCSNAMSQLSTLDLPVYQLLLKTKMWFWYEPRIRITAERCFGITEPWIAWEEKGIVTCLIWKYFEFELVLSKPLRRQ